MKAPSLMVFTTIGKGEKMKGMLVGLTVAFVLVGCGEASSSSGAGIESREGAGVTQSDSVTQSRELSQSQTNSVTVERPLLPIMSRVIAQDSLGEPMGSFVCVVLDLEPEHRAEGFENLKSWIRQSVAQIDPGTPVARMMALEVDDVTHACASSKLAKAFMPLRGWPSDINPLRASQTDLNDWLGETFGYGIAAAEFLPIIAEQLVNDGSLRTVDDYENATREAWQRLASDFVVMYLAERGTANRNFNVDLSGKSVYPVDFSNGSYHVGIDHTGMTLTNSGVTLIGADGVLNGQRYVATIESSTGSSMSRGSSSSSESDTSVNESSAGRVRVQ